MKTRRALTWAVASGALVLAVSCSPDGGGSGNQEICNNGIDDDGDGYTDCDDAECASTFNCTAQCGNGVCDPGEDEVSCSADCATNVEICGNQTDDDGDGLTDCDDSDCSGDPACGATGGFSCIGLSRCYQCCGQDAICQSACDADATPAAVSQLEAAYRCGQTHCSADCREGGDANACQSCMHTHCQAEADACDWGGTGTAGCKTTFVCLLGDGANQPGCPQPAESGTASTCPSDPGLLCYQDCFTATDQASTELLFDMSNCFLAARGPGGACEADCADASSTTCTPCIQNACATQINACNADG